MAYEGRKIKADDIGKGFYHLKRKLEGKEEEVVVGELCYLGKKEGVLTEDTYLSFLQPVQELTKEGKRTVAMLLYLTPEDNLHQDQNNPENIEGGELYLKSRDGTAKEYKRGHPKFDEFLNAYNQSLAEREKESSKLIDKLNRESREQ